MLGACFGTASRKTPLQAPVAEHVDPDATASQSSAFRPESGQREPDGRRGGARKHTSSSGSLHLHTAMNILISLLAAHDHGAVGASGASGELSRRPRGVNSATMNLLMIVRP